MKEEKESNITEFKIDTTLLNNLYTEMIDILNNLRLGKSNINEIKTFVSDLLKSEVVLGNQQDVPPIYIEPIPENDDVTTYGEFYRTKNYIVINSNTVEQCLKGQYSICRIINTVGHENTHYRQAIAQNEYIEVMEHKDLSNLKDEDKELLDLRRIYVKTIGFDFSNFTTDDLNNIYVMVKDYLTDDFKEKLKNIPKEKIQKYFKDITTSQYYDLKYEQEARLRGLIFLWRKFKEIYKHPYCNSELKEYLDKQRSEIHKIIDKEKERQEENPTLELFKKEFSAFTVNDLENLIKKYSKFETYSSYFYDSFIDYLHSEEYRKLSNFQFYTEHLLTKLTDFLYYNKTNDEQALLYESAVKGGCVNVLKILQKRVSINFSIDELNKIEDRICKILIEEDCKSAEVCSYLKDFPEGKLINLIKELLKRDKLKLAEYSISSLFEKFRDSNYIKNKDKTKIIDVYNDIVLNIINYAKNIIKKINNGDDKIVYQDLYSIVYLLKEDDLIYPDEYNKVVHSILLKNPEIDKICDDLVSYAKAKEQQFKEDDEGKYKNMRRVYGNSYTDNYIESKKNFSLHDEIVQYIQENNNSSKGI